MAMSSKGIFILAAVMAGIGIALGLKQGGYIVGKINKEAEIRTGLAYVLDNYGRKYAEDIERVS